MEPRTITLTQDRVTKNTVRYQEIGTDEPNAINTLYVQKAALGTPPPQRIKVTIEEA